MDHAAEARAVLAKAKDSLNAMYREADWTPADIAGALQTLYLEALVHAVLAVADGQPNQRTFIRHKTPRRSA